MEFVDRVSTYPNRYLLTAADGSTSYVVLERADNPLTVGTPLNAETLNQLALKEELENLKAEVAAMKGVNLFVYNDQNGEEPRVHSAFEVLDFDYFLVHSADSDTLRLLTVTSKDSDTRIVTAQDNLWSQDARYLKFTWEEQGGWYVTRYYQEDSAGQVDLEYHRIYGCKYPI